MNTRVRRPFVSKKVVSSCGGNSRGVGGARKPASSPSRAFYCRGQRTGASMPHDVLLRAAIELLHDRDLRSSPLPKAMPPAAREYAQLIQAVATAPNHEVH